MASENENAFKEQFQAAVIAKKRGAWGTARRYFLEAERSMRDAASAAMSDELKTRSNAMADRMKAEALDCAAALEDGRKSPDSDGGPASSGSKGADAPVGVEAPDGKISRSTCDRFQDKALEAEGRRDWTTATHYFVEAAKAFDELSRQPGQSGIFEPLQERAKMLRRKALYCESNQKGGSSGQSQRGGSGGGGGGDHGKEDGEPNAEKWMVKEKSTITFADVAGLEDVKEDIRLKMIYPFENPELAEKFGVRRGGGVLFYGPPGTGKTMLAKATAGEVDATFFRVSAADMLSKWVGEAEQNIKKLFDAAAAEKRSIIFIDEIESMIPARQDEGSSVMQRVVPQILQGMEGFDKKKDSAVLFMGATNVPWQLDPAVLRPGRFDDKVYIPLPDLPARRKLLELYLSKRPLDKSVNLDDVARILEGYSGADIKYVCDRSGGIRFREAVASGKPEDITIDVIEKVIQTAPKSVTPDMIKRFEKWALVSTNS